MREKPECCEVGVQVLRKDPAKVGFDPRRPREARVGPCDPHREPVCRKAPERRAAGVQGLLEEPECAPPAPVVSELWQGGIQACARRGYYDGNSVAAGEERNGIHALADRPWLRAHDGRETERVAQQRLKEALGKCAGVAS